jgi:hypothetical protein
LGDSTSAATPPLVVAGVAKQASGWCAIRAWKQAFGCWSERAYRRLQGSRLGLQNPSAAYAESVRLAPAPRPRLRSSELRPRRSERRHRTRQLHAGENTNAIVTPTRAGRSLLGASTSDELLGAAEIRTPAFRRSARAQGTVRAVAAISVPAGWGSTRASTRLRKPGSSASRSPTGALLPMQPVACAGGRVAAASRPQRNRFSDVRDSRSRRPAVCSGVRSEQTQRPRRAVARRPRLGAPPCRALARRRWGSKRQPSRRVPLRLRERAC